MGRKVTLNFVECGVRFWCYMSWSEYLLGFSQLSFWFTENGLKKRENIQ